MGTKQRKSEGAEHPMTGIEKKPGKTKIALKRLIDTCLSALGVALLAIPFGVIALAKRTPRVVSTPS